MVHFCILLHSRAQIAPCQAATITINDKGFTLNRISIFSRKSTQHVFPMYRIESTYICVQMRRVKVFRKRNTLVKCSYALCMSNPLFLRSCAAWCNEVLCPESQHYAGTSGGFFFFLCVCEDDYTPLIEN